MNNSGWYNGWGMYAPQLSAFRNKGAVPTNRYPETEGPTTVTTPNPTTGSVFTTLPNTSPQQPNNAYLDSGLQGKPTGGQLGGVGPNGAAPAQQRPNQPNSTPTTGTPTFANPYKGMNVLFRDSTGMLHDPGDNPIFNTTGTQVNRNPYKPTGFPIRGENLDGTYLPGTKNRMKIGGHVMNPYNSPNTIDESYRGAYSPSTPGTLLQDMRSAGLNGGAGSLMMASARDSMMRSNGYSGLSNEQQIAASRQGINSRDMSNLVWDPVTGKWKRKDGNPYISPGNTFNYNPMWATYNG